MANPVGIPYQLGMLAFAIGAYLVGKELLLPAFTWLTGITFEAWWAIELWGVIPAAPFAVMLLAMIGLWCIMTWEGIQDRRKKAGGKESDESPR